MLINALLASLFAAFLAAQEAATTQPAETSNKPDAKELSEQAVSAGPSVQVADDTPWILRWMIRPLRKKKGMLVKLPIIDTDPNRGTTAGVMPIWIIQEGPQDRIVHIHAPSVTYNKVFKAIPTYRYYYYPTDTSALLARAATSLQEERELLLSYDDEKFLGNDFIFSGKVQYNVDGALRFYGLGPASQKSQEANYVANYYMWKIAAGIPIVNGSKWKIHASHQVVAERLLNGRTPKLRNFTDRFPEHAAGHRHQTSEIGGWIAYDSRDHSVTTGQGTYLQAYSFHAIRDFMSEYDYNRFGIDLRHFWPYVEDKVIAGQLKYEQLGNKAPFWLQPRLGGKSSLRAYGEGRYVDRGMLSLNFEHRISLWKIPLAGVTTVFEVAPFMGMGTVFNTLGTAQAKYVRPVYGFAVRAVAKPQVVGSLDFGFGQEGMAAFIDINYSF